MREVDIEGVEIALNVTDTRIREKSLGIKVKKENPVKVFDR